jgi:hypothetical protein
MGIAWQTKTTSMGSAISVMQVRGCQRGVKRRTGEGHDVLEIVSTNPAIRLILGDCEK